MALQAAVSWMVLAAITVTLPACSVSANDTGKIPITTSSKKARELYLEGRDLQERLRANEARALFEQATTEDPNFALAFYGRALTATTAKPFFDNLKTAMDLADKASDGEKLLIKGLQAGADGNTAKQREFFTKLVALYPEDERAHNSIAGFYFGQQEYETAITEYEKAIAINPNFSQPYNQLGYSYRFLERYDDALKTFKKYIQVLPDGPNPYDSYAELLLKLGRYDESIENYQRALEMQPSFFASYLGIATNLNYKGEHSAARAKLDEMFKVAENTGQKRASHFAKAISYVFENDAVNAVQEVQAMYDLAEGIGDVAAKAGDLTTMGNLLVEFGKIAEAEAKYKTSLELIESSDQSEAQKELARQFDHLNAFQIAEARRNMDLATKHAAAFQAKAESLHNSGQIRLAHEMKGRIALLKEDYKTAVAELQQANQLNPYNFYRLGLAYDGMGDAKQAQFWFEKAKNFNPVNSLNQAFVARKSSDELSMK